MTASVQLHPWKLADAQEQYEAVIESTQELQPWMPWCTADYNKAETVAYIERSLVSRKAGTGYEFAIRDDAGLCCGTCGVNGVDQGNRVANLGYWIRTSRTGCGLATATTIALRDWAFEHTNLNRLEIVVATGNIASLRVAEKAGAIREGLLGKKLMLQGRAHDAVMYAYLRPDE